MRTSGIREIDFESPELETRIYWELTPMISKFELEMVKFKAAEEQYYREKQWEYESSPVIMEALK